MKKWLFFGVVVSMILALAGCGFNVEQAKKDSRKQLKSFFEAYKNDEEIGKVKGSKEINSLIDQKFSEYMTSSYLEKVHYNVEEKDGISNGVAELFFFLYDGEDLTFQNKYKVTLDKVNEKKQSVTYYLHGETGITPSAGVKVTMVQEDNKWKIDSAE
ncbi:hypothetical protein P5633_00130 (plasmid) [Bacillus subtilis]|uniref:Uncharacterized protein n=1 Tax=Bacillus subtilis TaxID=1423 RepID=A0AAX3RHZ7_BACIU|nr:hypothetical protein P5633_00130 [Bacillus subtilis]